MKNEKRINGFKKMEEEKLKHFFIEEKKYIYLPLNEQEIKQVYNLYFKNIEDDVTSSNSTHYYGLYYHLKEDYTNMMKYYLLSIEKGNVYSMNNMGVHFKEKKDYVNMFKYLDMVIENNNDICMLNLGTYYEEIGDYENMMKYYNKSIEKGNAWGLLRKGYYYKSVGENRKMLKNIIKSIESGNKYALNALIKTVVSSDFPPISSPMIVSTVGGSKLSEEIIKKILKLKEEKRNQKSEIEKLLKKIQEQRDYITELELTPGGKEYLEVKKHFELNQK